MRSVLSRCLSLLAAGPLAASRPVAAALAGVTLLALGVIASIGKSVSAAEVPDAPAAARGRVAGQAGPPGGYRDQYAGKKKVLVIGDLHTGTQIAHDSVSHAMAVIDQLGRSSGDFIAFLRTDTELVTKGEVWGKGDYAKGGSKQAGGHNLDYFDAVVFYTNGETEMSDQQKQDLLTFVRDDGKGFIGIHTATATLYKFPEYGEMVGAYFDNHPWNVFDAPVRVERPDSPIVRHLPREFIMRDEMYQYRAPYARDKVDVLLSMDPARLDLTNPNVHRTDRDFPLAWTRSYGKGRVFSSSLGHADKGWDDPRLQTMYLEAIRWALRLTDAPVQPHAAPAPDPQSRDYLPGNVPQGTGRYPAVMEVDPTLPTHTVYRPQRLASLGTNKLPVVAWANGACFNVGNRFRYFLTEIASHGYLAIAIGPPGSAALEASADSAPAIGEPADPMQRAPATQATQLIDAINWAVAENARRGSAYYGRLDTNRIAVMGQSCGGLQAIVAAADPRVTTTMIWNSGTFASGNGLPGAPATKASLAKLHTPTAYISGDSSDIAFPNANADFEALQGIPLFRGYEAGVGHNGTYREHNGGEFGQVAVAWLDWQLKADHRSGRMFVGKQCGLCANPRWTVSRKNLD